jgi:hypothetical protein
MTTAITPQEREAALARMPLEVVGSHQGLLGGTPQSVQQILALPPPSMWTACRKSATTSSTAPTSSCLLAKRTGGRVTLHEVASA